MRPLRSFARRAICLVIPVAAWVSSIPVAAPAAPEAAWSKSFSVPGVTGTVACLGSYGDVLVAGGNFEFAGPGQARGIALWDESGWRPLGNGDEFAFRTTIRAVVEYGTGLIAAGDAPGTDGRRRSVVWYWDGTRWTALHSNAEAADTSVRTLLVLGGQLYAGGHFQSLGGRTCSNVARWDGSTWEPLGAGTSGNSGEVAVLIRFENELVAAGNFSRAGGTLMSSIAAWNGTAWHPVGFGLQGSVETLAEFGGDLYAGGWFDYAGGLPARRIARWDGVS